MWGDDDPPPLGKYLGRGQLWKGTDSSPSNGIIKNPAAPLNKSKVSKVADKQSFQWSSYFPPPAVAAK